MATKKENKNKEVELLKEKDILMTEEEYAKKSREITKERMNRVLRVVGLVASIILIYVGLFDPLFELTYFGWMADKVSHDEGWLQLVGLGIFDDEMQFGTWLPKLGLTLVLIFGAVGIIYLVVYNIVDIIAMIKSFYMTGFGVTTELSSTIKDSAQNEFAVDKKKRKKVSLFAKNETDEEFTKDGSNLLKEGFIEEEKPKVKRRKEKDSSEGAGGLSSEELDILLSGGTLEGKDISSEEDELKI